MQILELGFGVIAKALRVLGPSGLGVRLSPGALRFPHMDLRLQARMPNPKCRSHARSGSWRLALQQAAESKVLGVGV